MPRSGLLALLPLLCGCNVLALTTADEVIRPRVVGVRAEPAEIGLGESTELSALLVHPQGAPPDLGTIWFACLEGGSARGCVGADFGSLLGGGGDDDDSAGGFDPGGLQFGVGDAFTYTAQGRFIDDAWAALDPKDRVEGLSVLISVNYVHRGNDALRAMMLELAAAGQNGDQATLDRIGQEFGDLLGGGINAARRIVVSDKSADDPGAVACPVQELLPNQNPVLSGLVVHTSEDGLDEGYPLGAVTFVQPEEELFLRPALPPSAREDYLYITLDGVTECRRETPYFAWMTNAGHLEAGNTFIADPADLDEIAGRAKANHLTMPDRKDFQEPVDLWVVMRDRRGGVAFGHWLFVMADPPEGQ